MILIVRRPNRLCIKQFLGGSSRQKQFLGESSHQKHRIEIDILNIKGAIRRFAGHDNENFRLHIITNSRWPRIIRLQEMQLIGHPDNQGEIFKETTNTDYNKKAALVEKKLNSYPFNQYSKHLSLSKKSVTTKGVLTGYAGSLIMVYNKTDDEVLEVRFNIGKY